MDEKDKLILFELLQDCRQSVSKIAKSVRLPQQTVDKRIKKLEKSGVIKKYALNVNYPKFGFSRHSIYLDIHGVSAKDVDRYLKEITSIGEVSCVICYMRLASGNYMFQFGQKLLKDMMRYRLKY